jgi:outer membrane protein assembly factor BamB
MKQYFQIVTLILFMIIVLIGSGSAEWNQFMGADRTGVVKTDIKLSEKWPSKGPKVLWTTSVSEGYGGASIYGDKVYIMDRDGEKGDKLRCLDIVKGKELWNYKIKAPGDVHKKFPGSRSTPSVDENYVFVIGAYGDFHCVDKKTHKTVWKKHIVDDYNVKLWGWKVSQSPLLYKEMVIISPSQGPGMVAFHKKTGKEIWKSEGFGKMSFASPSITKLGGIDQVITVAGSKDTTVVGVDANNGKLLWKYEGNWSCRIPVPGPTPIGDGRIFVTGDYGAGSAMFKVEKSGSGFKTKHLFNIDKHGSHVHNALLYKNHLYANCSKDKKGLVCFYLNGKVKWSTGTNPDFDLGGGFVLVNDLIYIMNGATGELFMVKAEPTKYQQLGKAEILKSKDKMWAPVVFNDGKLFVRGHKYLKCVDVSSQ